MICHPLVRNYKEKLLLHHRQVNIDLYLEYWQACNNLHITSTWIKGRQDKGRTWETIEDLKKLDLSNEAKLNCLCNRWAGDNNVNTTDDIIQILPNERWALISRHPYTRKVVGKLSHAISDNMHREPLLQYIHRKHRLCEAKRDQIGSSDLRLYLLSLPYHRRASTIKLMHGWMPCNLFLWKQRRSDSPICPRCNLVNESKEHILSCTNQMATQAKYNSLQNMIQKLRDAKMDPNLLHALHSRLHVYLELGGNPYVAHDDNISEVIKHQNIIGWRHFLCGYVPSKWEIAQHKYECLHNISSQLTLSHLLIKYGLQLHKEIWQDRNNVILGITQEEIHKRELEALKITVRQIYEEDFPLHARFTPIRLMPLELHLNRSTKYLKQWIHKIQHQKRVTQAIYDAEPMQQLTIRQAFQRAGHSLSVGSNDISL